MNISFFTDCLYALAYVFANFPPLMWVLCGAILCAIVYIIRSFVSMR